MKIKAKENKVHSTKRKKRKSKSKAQRKKLLNLIRKMAQTTIEDNNSQPSTSGEIFSRKSPAKKRKTFEKFKDNNKHRQILIQKYKLNKKKKQNLRLKGLSSPSLSQITSQKIIQQIKRRHNKSNSKSPPKSKMKDETRKSNENTTKSEESDDDDDDCVCIETKPEVILIEDEVNVVKELENKYLKFKHYQSIGSIRLKESNVNVKNNQMITSTPNTSRKMPYYQDTNASFGLLSNVGLNSDINIVEDKTLTPNVNVANSMANGEVIVIEDTFVPQMNNKSPPPTSRSRSKRSNPHDDSVIFVSETIGSRSPVTNSGFIPLNTPAQEVKVHLPPVIQSPLRKRKKCTNDLFTSKEEKQLQIYNNNAYNPNKNKSDDENSKKRMVLVDGSNVAYHHSLNKEFSVKGLKICVDYFAKMGHEVKAVVPQYRLQKTKSSDPAELESLHRQGKIIFTPCKNLPGKSATSYDDRFTLQLASELDAAVISNDNYRDLINENAAFKKIIENRVIGFTWCNDVFILPKDPYGRMGPSLASILNRS